MITIDIKLATSAPTSPLIRTINKFEKMDAALTKVNEKLERTRALLASISMANPKISIPSGGSSGGGGGKGGRVPGLPTAAQAFSKAYDEFKYFDQMMKRSNGKMGAQGRQSAMQRANGLAQQMAGQGNYSGMNRMLPHIMPQMPQSFSQKLKNALMTSRIGAGAGGLQIAPLVGRLAALNPALGIATVAIGAMAQAAMAAKGAMDEMAKNRAVLGGSAAQSANAVAMAKALGLDPQTLSSSLNEAIKSGGGAGFAAQAGINSVGGPFGDNNYAKKLTKALDFIANSSSYDEARRRAEGLGMSEAANAYYLPKGLRDALGGQSGLSGKEMVTQAKATAAMTIAMTNLNSLLIKTFGPAIDAFATVMVFLNKFQPVFEKIATMLSTTVFSALQIIAKILEAIASRLGIDLNGVKNELRANTSATNSLNRTMGDMRETFGGGRRVQGALPGKLRGNHLNPAAQGAIGSGVRVF